MKKDEIQIIIDLGMGSCDHTVWTCDFSHKYIDINTDYDLEDLWKLNLLSHALL